MVSGSSGYLIETKTIVATAFAAFLAAALLVAPGAAGGSVAPDCATGPQRTGDEITGTPCDDTIFVPVGVASVEGGEGDDTIVAAPISAQSAPCPAACHLGIGSQTYDGGPGDDIVFGERGNDILEGGEGNDQLFGGIGDDLLQGGPGADRLAGGFGADSIDGQGGDDYVHGDGTIDTIVDSGGGTDTLGYGTGVTPGFPNNVAYPDFSAYPGLPSVGGERGVYLSLGGDVGDNGVAPNGGGVDKVEGDDFEVVLGTPFPDFISGTAAGQVVYGGGGGDVILGEGGADQIHGGAGGDRCASAGSSDCETASGAVVQRDPTKIAVGLIAPGATPYSQLYLTGSDDDDLLTAAYSAAPSPRVVFTLAAGSSGQFDTDAASSSGCGAPSGGQVECSLAAPLDSILLAGLRGDDSIAENGFPDTVAVVIAGGPGGDTLQGGQSSEDVLVDGPDFGADTLTALGGDDALLHNGGADEIDGGGGNDLFLSDSVCDENSIAGGGGRDNASWARFDEGVAADVAAGVAGRPGPSGEPACPSGSLDGFTSVEDLEGSNFEDVFAGGPEANQLLGHRGPDIYHARAGADRILANSGDSDPIIDCGGDSGDIALVDRHPQYEDATPVGCERVVEADPNSFRVGTELPPETQPPDGVEEQPRQTPPPRDRVAPRTRIVSRPKAVLRIRGRSRRVSFRFASSERGSRFRCGLDRRPARSCRSPRAYVVGLGRHRFRVVAIDAAGNADRSPARATVRVRRR
jgi:Ca2+-binding RTX toxin-like protein